MKPLKIGELEATEPIVRWSMGVGISLSGLSLAIAETSGICGINIDSILV
ncbi:MAG: hypothetical protein IJW88_02980 [Alistipes sp.]|nr:hypothetical protein [Alistipes sp.]